MSHSPAKSHASTRDLFLVASLAAWRRGWRTLLSSAGVAVGAAAVVAIVGISNASEADLLGQIDEWSTLLRASTGQSIGSTNVGFSPRATAMANRIAPVLHSAGVANLDLTAYRTDLTPPAQSNGLVVLASDPTLLETLHVKLAKGRFLSSTLGLLPVTVLGQTASERLGIERVGVRIRIEHRWFTVIGILRAALGATDIDSAVLVGFGAAEKYLGYRGGYSELFVRVYPGQAEAVASVLPLTLQPSAPQTVRVVEATNVLALRSDADRTLNALVFALGAVAFVIGGLGIANTMLISIGERQVEIAMRMALGARRRHIAAQFMFESLVMSAAGGVGGAAAGLVISTTVAATRSWPIAVSWYELAVPAGASLLVGLVAGFIPAVRAAHLSPSRVLRSM